MPTSQDNANPEQDFAGLKGRSLDGAAATAGSQAVKFVLQLVSQIWLARLISPAEYGLVAMVAPILGFISIISDMGIGMALVQQKSISQSQISCLFWLNAAISAVICLVLIAISPAVGLLYHEPKTVSITIALAALFFVSTFSIYPAAILNRQMRLATRAGIESIASFLGLTVGILTAMAGCSYWSLIYMQAANTVCSVLLTWISAGWRPSRLRWDPTAMKILRFGTSLTVSNIAMYFSTSADNMIVGAVAGKVQLGLYDKAYRLVVWPISQLSAPFGRVAIPLLAQLEGEPRRYITAFKKMIQLPNLICLPGLIWGMFLSQQLVQVFLGPKWTAIAPVSSWVCVGGVGSILYGSASWLFTSQGRGRDQMKWSVITSAINIVSFVIGIRWGAVGVAAVSGISFSVIQTPMILWAATRTGPVRPRLLIETLAPMALALTITAPAVYLFSRWVHGSAYVELVEGLLLAYGLYLTIVSLMSSGREALSGSAALLLSYFSRLRTAVSA